MMGIHKHLIRQFLIAGIMDKGLVKSSTIGMPQGRTAFSNPIKYILRKKAVARPIGVTLKQLNQFIVSWINYFRIGNMEVFMEEYGSLAKTQSKSNYSKAVEKAKNDIYCQYQD